MELFEEIEERYVEVNGVKLHTVVVGSGEPIILLHGFPDFWYAWKNVIMELKNEFQLIVPDTRGINLSERPEGVENYDIKILVNDVKKLSEELNIGKFTLVGHDWGGAIAWVFAEMHPDLLKKLIIINAPHPKALQRAFRTSKEQKMASAYMLDFRKPGYEDVILANDCQMLKEMVFNNPNSKKSMSEYDKNKYLEAWKQPGSIKAGLNYYRAMKADQDSTGIISLPTLVLHGMKDQYILPVLLEILPELIEDLKIIRIEDSSHWVMHDVPDVVVSSIREFVK
jgi:pimeloyl-ACP methyl ester carboxylesterase